MNKDEEEDSIERKRRKTPKKRFIDGQLVTKLDALGLSSYQSVRVISEVAQALGHLLDDLVVSRRTIERVRSENRKKIAAKIKSDFSVILKILILLLKTVTKIYFLLFF